MLSDTSGTLHNESQEPGGGESWFVWALKVFLVVAVAILIAAIIFSIAIHPPPPDDDPCSPPAWQDVSHIQLGTPMQFIGMEWKVEVEGASSACNLSDYRAVLIRNGSMQGDAMDPLAETTVGNITFQDLTDDLKLSVGDYFTISTWAGGNYELVIIWKDSGNVMGSKEWET